MRLARRPAPRTSATECRARWPSLSVLGEARLIAEADTVSLLDPTRAVAEAEAPDAFQRLHERIARRQARVAVMGLGYVGLPLALAYAEGGFRTTGVDVDARRVSALRAGQSP